MSLDSILRSVGKNLFDKLASGKGWLDSATGNVITTTVDYTSGFIPIENLKTYFCTGKKVQNWACLYDENKSFLSPYLPGTGSTGSFSLTINNSKAKYMRIIMPNASESDLETVQVELGDKATTYEPYHQGPQSIKIPYSGKNLITYPYYTVTKTVNGVTFTVGSDGGITVNGTATPSTAVFTIKNPIVLGINKQYTLSGMRSGACQFSLQDKSYQQSVNITKQNQTATITTSFTQYYVYLAVGKSETANNVVVYPQLEEGIQATEYSLNTGDKEVYKVSYGSRNLFDISSSVGFQSYYSGVTSTISGTTITTSSTANRGCQLLLGDFPVGTYTISFSNTDFALLMLQYGEALGQLSRLDNVNFVSTKSHTFTLTQPRKLWLESTIATNTTKTITDIQIELGDKATEYVPYSKEVVWTKAFATTDTLGNFELGKSVLA